MIQKILCPTDLTDNSKDSVAYALGLAKENSAQLIVFHTTSFPSLGQYPYELELYYPWERLVSRFQMDQVIAHAERQVKSFVHARFGAEINGVAWKPRISLGKVSEEIVIAAFQEEVDLIVMARCKRTPLARILSRSISEAVSRKAPCPVLSIDAKQITFPYRGWRLPLSREIFQSS